MIVFVGNFEIENSLITLTEALISFLISKFFIHSDKASTFSDSNNTPFLNNSITSLGPEGQSDDIIFLPKICASINEFLTLLFSKERKICQLILST